MARNMQSYGQDQMWLAGGNAMQAEIQTQTHTENVAMPNISTTDKVSFNDSENMFSDLVEMPALGDLMYKRR